MISDFKSNHEYIFLYIILILSLAPISVNGANGDGISANYLFVLMIPLLSGFNFKSNSDALSLIIIFSICFFSSLPFNYYSIGFGAEDFARQSVSFFVFLCPFVLLFIDLNRIELFFIRSVVIVSIFYSIFALVFFLLNISPDGVNPFLIKEILSDKVPDWPQRYSLVLLAGFFFSFDARLRSGINSLMRLIILLALIITFLRAVYLAIFIGYLANCIFLFLNNNSRVSLGRFIWVPLCLVALTFMVGQIFFGGVLESFSIIVNYFINSVMSLVNGDGAQNVSDQTRLDIIIDGFRQLNPIFGLGGGGIYFLIPEIGSAHNQFFDYYVRFGIVGVVTFIYFNFRIIRYYLKSKPWVVGLMFSYIVFGAAHETTKYSYGALIFFFLLSLTYTEKYRDTLTCTHPNFVPQVKNGQF